MKLITRPAVLTSAALLAEFALLLPFWHGAHHMLQHGVFNVTIGLNALVALLITLQVPVIALALAVRRDHKSYPAMSAFTLVGAALLGFGVLAVNGLLVCRI